MAKNKVYIDIVVDDKGTTKKVAVDATTLGSSLDKASKSSRTFDRNLKGAAQASANGSKNFSKMAQGMTGGLVPAYAAFAAQIFALTAAFGFLKRAADLENLRKSQVNFAQSSGLAIKSLTGQLREASGGMLGFQEAAQAAAIGVAKGFSGLQLEQLTEGAAKAAGSLGRGFDDTFDRLLRGVSKAEPELLDELGITLRLEEATQRYGDAIGKSKDELTAAERSQAVFNETMRQLNATFGDQDKYVNPFIILSKTFEDIIQKIQTKLLPAFTAFANVINQNATAAAVAFGALATIILANIAGLGPALKSVMVGLGSGFMSSSRSIRDTFTGLTGAVGSGISRAAKAAVYEIEFAELELTERLEKLGGANVKGAAGKLQAGGVSSVTVGKLAAGEEVTPRALGRLKKDLQRVRKELQDTGKVAKGAFAGATLEAVDDLEAEIAKIGKTTLSTKEKIQKAFGKGTVNALDRVSRAAKTTGKAFVLVGKGARIAGNAIKGMTRIATKLFLVAGVVSAIITAFEKLATTPITVIDGFKSFLSGLAKGLQIALNLFADGLNALLDNSVVRRLLGIEEGERVVGRFTFADGIDKKLDALEKKALAVFGLERGDLEKIEKKTRGQQEQEEAVANLRDRYSELRTEIDTITAGIKAQEDPFKKTAQIATAIATLPIEGALKKAAESGDFGTVFEDILGDVDLSSLGEPFATAVAEKNIPKIQELSSAATTYNASLASINDAAASLKQNIGTGDPLGAEILLGQLIAAAKAGDEAAATLGRDGGILDLLSRNAGTDAEGLFASLQRIRLEMDAIADDRSALQIAQVKQSRAPGAVGRQQGLDFAAQEAVLAVREKTKALEQFQLVNENLTAKERLEHDQEVARRQREIALLQEKANVASTNATEIGQLGIAVGNSMASSMQSAFDGLIQGTMSAKEAFGNMAKSMLQAIAKVISELLVAKLLTAALGSTGPLAGFGSFLGIGARTGGMFEPVPGYATGGIARGRDAGYPAILHGTEAVVPLPNGKSIPVEMQNGGGQTNNVTVNVSVDSDGNAQRNSQQSSMQGGNLGNAIAVAVQKELQNQKRSGGILNPYGAA